MGGKCQVLLRRMRSGSFVEDKKTKEGLRQKLLFLFLTANISETRKTTDRYETMYLLTPTCQMDADVSQLGHRQIKCTPISLVLGKLGHSLRIKYRLNSCVVLCGIDTFACFPSCSVPMSRCNREEMTQLLNGPVRSGVLHSPQPESCLS